MARRASRAMAAPLERGATQSMGADKPTRRAFPWCPADRVAVLVKGAAITCAPRLAAKHHGNAEPINTMLLEH